MLSLSVMYVMDTPKRQEKDMSTGRQSHSSFRQVLRFILRADRDTGRRHVSLRRTVVHWYIGMIATQNHDCGSMAEDMVLWLMDHHWCTQRRFGTGGRERFEGVAYIWILHFIVLNSTG